MIGAVVLELNEENNCNYTIDEDHIFFPSVRVGELSGFHSTARAIETVHYEWVTEPPENAYDEPFTAKSRVPSHPSLEKVSSFFPIDLDDYGVIDMIGNAYEQKCIPTGAWDGIGIDPFTGITFRIEGFVKNHHIKSAFLSGLI
ncbi:MAG: hypothetical protein WBA13_09760 [Microcoleaceae cyanobacterium]